MSVLGHCLLSGQLGHQLLVVGPSPTRVEQDLRGLVVDAEATIGRVEVGDGGPPRGPDLVGGRGGLDVEDVVPAGGAHELVTGW